VLGTVALLVAAVVLLTAPAAGAQDDDPYGGTTTTEAPQVVPACELGVTVGAPGVQALVTLTSVPAGATVRILLDGDEVARDTAPLQEDGGPATTTMEIPFTVPDVAPDTYTVTAVGADFTVVCEPDGQFGVLDAEQQRLPGVFGGITGLPRTGIYAALLVVIALVLVVAGRTLLGASRRRKEAERRARAGRRRSTSVAR
jgi:hypothetical protein